MQIQHGHCGHHGVNALRDVMEVGEVGLDFVTTSIHLIKSIVMDRPVQVHNKQKLNLVILKRVQVSLLDIITVSRYQTRVQVVC